MPNPSETFSIESHFDSKDTVVRKTYDRLLAALKSLGPIVQDPKKTSIHLVNKTAFAGIATRKAHIVLTLKSDHKLASGRVHRSQRTSAKRFHEEIKLGSPAEIDAELIGWLRAAYALSS